MPLSKESQQQVSIGQMIREAGIRKPVGMSFAQWQEHIDKLTKVAQDATAAYDRAAGKPGANDDECMALYHAYLNAWETVTKAIADWQKAKGL